MQQLLDSEEDRRRREAMVEHQLRARGISDERVLAAMASVPRHLFVPPELRARAYDDCALPIGEGQTISQPYMVALMLQALGLTPDSVALEVGAGSGYQAALLGRLCRKVYAMEIVPTLAEGARQVLRRLGIDNVEVITGDGSLGLPDHAPYDAIIVAAAAPDVPPPLKEQLADGGRLVAPVGGRYGQQLVICERQGGELVVRHGINCVFVPLLGAHGWQAEC